MPVLPSLATAPPALRSLAALLVPIGLLVLAAVLVRLAADLDFATRRLLVYLPYALLLAAVVLAQYFNRVRPLAAAILLLTAYWLIRHHLQTSLDAPVPQAIYTVVGIVVPLGLAVLCLAGERGVWTWRAAAVTLCAPALLVAGTMLCDGAPARAQALAAWLPAKPIDGYVLSWGATVAFAGSLAAMVALGLREDRRFESALIGCLLCVFGALAFFHMPLISTVMFSTAAVILVTGLLQRSYAMAYRDQLTGLLGRRALDERLISLGRVYTIALLDVDHFKKFNDRHGHEAGDEALKMVATRLLEVTGGGIPYRYGGEEFCVVFPRRTLDDCRDHVEALRQSIEAYPLVLRDAAHRPEDGDEAVHRRGRSQRGNSVSLSVSIGLAEPAFGEETPEEVLKTADLALYAAKDGGRNRLAWFEAVEDV